NPLRPRGILQPFMQAAAQLIGEVVVHVGRENPLETLPGSVAIAVGQPDQADDEGAPIRTLATIHLLQKFVLRHGPRDIFRRLDQKGSVDVFASGNSASKALSGFRSLSKKQKDPEIAARRQQPLLLLLTNLLLVFLVRLVATVSLGDQVDAERL